MVRFLSINYNNCIESQLKKPFDRGHWVFVSPHLDDAWLSCGALIAGMAGKKRITVVTVFTESDGRYRTWSIRNFLRKSRARDPISLYRLRRQEDKEIGHNLGVETVHLGFTDGLFRTKTFLSPIEKLLSNLLPEVRFVYPIFSLKSAGGAYSPADNPLISQISEAITYISDGDSLIFVPAAIGGHVDHLLVKEAVGKSSENTVYWSDFPYNQWQNKYIPKFAEKGFETFKWNENSEQKIRILNQIKSQINLVFPDGNIPRVEEFYFFKNP